MPDARASKVRPFGRGLALSALTLGVYGAYWNWVAHRELHRAFRLEEEGRGDGRLWYALALVLLVPYVVYARVFLDNLRHVRARLGLPPARGLSAARFALLQAPAHA